MLKKPFSAFLASAIILLYPAMSVQAAAPADGRNTAAGSVSSWFGSAGNVPVENIVYVSADGKSNAAGTLNDPYPTVQAARDALKNKTSAERPGVVYIRGGVYTATQDNPTVELTGSECSYVTYKAYNNEKVEFTGSVTLDTAKFYKLSEVTGSRYSSQSRLQDGVKDKVFVYDLGADKIPVGSINKNGFNWKQQPYQPELIVDGSTMTLAEYPNTGYMNSSVLLTGKEKKGPGTTENAKAAIAAGANMGDAPRAWYSDKTDTPKTYEEMLAMNAPVFYCVNSDLLSRYGKWAPPTEAGEPQGNQPDKQNIDNTAYETDGWLNGYFENNYANDSVRIYSVDQNKKLIHCKYPSLQGVQDKRLQLTATNLLCELDTEGEYYIDRYNGNNVLYYYPGGDTVSGKSITLSSSDKPLFNLNGVTGVTIQGIKLGGTTSNGIVMLNCESCTIDRCEMANTSMDAVKIGESNGAITAEPAYTTSKGGHNNKVTNSTMHDLGSGGVFLAGGDRKTLERGNNTVEHCEFYNFSKLVTYTPAVYLNGVGNSASYNYIHDAPHMVVQIMGNDMVFSHNKVENVATNTSDQGAIYSGRDWTYLGNEISYNYFTGIKGKGNWAIYMDDGMSSMNIHHNVFADSDNQAIFFNSGRGHSFTDNVIINNAGGVGKAQMYGTITPANINTLAPRFNSMLQAGDGTGYTNTQQNVDKWYEHYARQYPSIKSWYVPTTGDGLKDANALVVQSGYTFARNVQINTKDFDTSKSADITAFNPEFNTVKYTAASADEVSLNAASLQFGEQSALNTAQGFGADWVKNWNSSFSLDQIGVQPLYQTTFTLPGIRQSTPVLCTVDGGTPIAASTDSEGKVDLWLPETGASEVMTVLFSTGSKRYITSGTIAASGSSMPQPVLYGITKIQITPSSACVVKGLSQSFNADITVSGGAPKDIVWSVKGNNSRDTAIDSTGMLTVAENETAASLTVTAASKSDGSTFGTADVVVQEKSVAKIEMKSNPAKTSYIEGQMLDLTGAEIEVTYNNGTSGTAALTYDMVSGYNGTQTGTQTVAVTYGGRATAFQVNVVPDAVADSSGSILFDLKDVQLPSGVSSVSVSGEAVSQQGGNDSVYDAVNRLLAGMGQSSQEITVYDLKLLDQGGNAISHFSGTVKVKVPIPAGVSGDLHIFWYNDADDTLTDMNAAKENGYLVFETNHFSYYAIAPLASQSSGGPSSQNDSSEAPSRAAENPQTGDNYKLLVLLLILGTVSAAGIAALKTCKE